MTARDPYEFRNRQKFFKRIANDYGISAAPDAVAASAHFHAVVASGK
jgi:hypothetical protein